jgi:hypothetical protein
MGVKKIMCLNSITTRYPKDDTTEGAGWKIFEYSKIEKHYCFPCCGGCVKFNKWLNRRIVNIDIGVVDNYESGFHIFTTKNDAEQHWLNFEDYKWFHPAIFKVKYKGIVCTGIEIPLDVLVVKKIFVEKECNN